jgi:hypothetical protein
MSTVSAYKRRKQALADASNKRAAFPAFYVCVPLHTALKATIVVSCRNWTLYILSDLISRNTTAAVAYTRSQGILKQCVPCRCNLVFSLRNVRLHITATATTRCSSSINLSAPKPLSTANRCEQRP